MQHSANHEPAVSASSQRWPEQGAVLTRRGLTVILPAWNEASIIATTVHTVSDALTAAAPDFEIVVVDDGSVDRTGAILDELATADARVRVIHHATNSGYGAALISGFDAANKELLFFMDADGQFDIHDIDRLIIPYEQGQGDAIIGYRLHRQDPAIRKLNAWAWKRLVSLLFHLNIRDIDCAFKLMPTRLIRCADVHAQGAMVNTEFLAKFARMHVRVVQVPVNHYPRQKGKATGANLRVIFHAFRELFRLAGKLRSWTPPPADA